MAGIPGVRVKAFVVQRVGEGEPQKATMEFVPNPRYVDMPQAALDVLSDTELLRLTLPDGSEWLVDDKTLEFVLTSARESRAHFAKT